MRSPDRPTQRMRTPRRSLCRVCGREPHKKKLCPKEAEPGSRKPTPHPLWLPPRSYAAGLRNQRSQTATAANTPKLTTSSSPDRSIGHT